MVEFETGTETLLARRDGHVAVITFNRPERRNALTIDMYYGFREVLPLLAVDPEVRVVMVTGAGGAFCAGGDVKGMNESNQSGKARAGQPDGYDDKIAFLRMRHRWVSQALFELPKPVVAAIPGPAAGAGLSMALAADLRVAAERALLVTAFANIGASGDFGGSWFLTHLLGAAKAKELYFTSPRMTAATSSPFSVSNFMRPSAIASSCARCSRMMSSPRLYCSSQTRRISLLISSRVSSEMSDATENSRPRNWLPCEFA